MVSLAKLQPSPTRLMSARVVCRALAGAAWAVVQALTSALAPSRSAQASAEAAPAIDRHAAARALARLEVDEAGLDSLDRRYLRCLIEHYGGGPAGVETLAYAIAEARDAVEDVIEPFLMQQGFIQRTPRGRVAAGRAYLHLGLTAPPQRPGQGEMFEG